MATAEAASQDINDASHPAGLDNLDPSKPPPTAPVVARMYDYYMNGTHNYAIDRAAADAVERALPNIKPLVVENRAFLRRAIRYLSKRGITQFIDLGSGLPTAKSTHETALKMNPGARVLYVDIEETVVREGREVIRKDGVEGRVGMRRGDALDPATVLDDAETGRVIDFSKPVAILMIALIHFFTEEQYRRVLATIKGRLVRGSYLVVTHVTNEERDPEGIRGTKEVYKKAGLPIYFRPRSEIAAVMEGWEVVEPGVVRPNRWRMEEMESGEEEPPITTMWFVGVGKLV